MSHSFTFLKTWGKGLKQLKTLKNDQFHNFEHSYLPKSLIKQTKKKLGTQLHEYSYDFVQFHNKPPLNLSKNVGKTTQTSKHT